MKLSEETKTSIKSITKQRLDLAKQNKLCDIDIETMREYVKNTFVFLGLTDVNQEDIDELVHDLEYEVSIHHTKGCAIFNVYDSNLHNWYDKIRTDNQPFWNRYRRYLIEKSSLDQKSIDLLDFDTLPKILNCLGNPNEEFEGKRVVRGLIIGDVQSGKTSTYTGLICKAADAGYKVIILLAGTTESLRQQTQERIDEGVIGYTYPKTNKSKTMVKVGVGEYIKDMPATAFTSVQRDFVSGSESIATSINQHKSIVVFVCKKNVSVLKKLFNWLYQQNIDKVKGYVDAPMLLIDDEADNASVNTKKDEIDPTKTNKFIRDICNLFKNSTYVGFTATPFANIFIDPDSVDSMQHADLFPEDFIYSLPTPSSYIGAKRLFFSDGDYYDNLRFIADIEEPDYSSEEYRDLINNEIESLNSGTFYFQHKKEWNGILPNSLRESVLSFFIGNVIRDLRGDIFSPRSMLVNMSRFVKVQNVIRDYIETIYNEVIRTITYDFDDILAKNTELPLYKELFEVWDKHYSSYVDIVYSRVLDKSALLKAISDIKIWVVNGSKASNKLDYKANPNLRVIAVGGLALSRGLTLEGLLTSYFYRNTATFDVLMQMGRWFGYRRRYEDLFQVWTTQSSAMWYAEIAEASELLKADIKDMFEQHLTPKEFGLKVRDNCEALQITASNKMRSAKTYDFRIAYYGNIYDTPYLSLNAEQNKENLAVVSELVKKLFASNYQYRFAAIDRHSKDDVNSTDIHESRYFANVPKSVVREFLTKIKCSLLNMNFNIDSIVDFIDDSNNIGIDTWNIVFEGGDSNKACQIPGLENIYCSKRTIYDHGNAIQISSRRRILGTREGKFCLTKSEIEVAENKCKNQWASDGISEANIEKKDIPIKAYFKYLKNREPILIILPIKPEIGEEKPTKPNGEAFKKFVSDLGDDQIIAFAIGFPGVKNEEDAVSYKVNKTWLRINGLLIDEESFNENEEEYDG